jgi:hypothetical protein
MHVVQSKVRDPSQSSHAARVTVLDKGRVEASSVDPSARGRPASLLGPPTGTRPAARRVRISQPVGLGGP